MDTQKSHFHRNLLITLIVLFVLTLAAFVYAVWAGEQANMLGWEMLLNIPILSIPLILIFGSVYVLLMGWYERSTIGKVSPRLAKIIHWTPRIAAILIILFAGLFSLDVFGTGASPLETLGDFLMHNIPSIVMLVLLIFAWKRPVVGFVAFLVVAVAFTILFVRDFYAVSNLLLFVLPLLLIASLFYADWKWLEA
jgi:hypothetical protein